MGIEPRKMGIWQDIIGVSYGKLGSLTYLVGMEAAVNGARVVRILKKWGTKLRIDSPHDIGIIGFWPFFVLTKPLWFDHSGFSPRLGFDPHSSWFFLPVTEDHITGGVPPDWFHVPMGWWSLFYPSSFHFYHRTVDWLIGFFRTWWILGPAVADVLHWWCRSKSSSPLVLSKKTHQIVGDSVLPC